jgi:predicted small lipoprotein YifL
MCNGLNKRVVSAVLLIACTSLLSGCGRKAALEAPVVKTSGEVGETAKEPVRDKPFILDPLL